MLLVVTFFLEALRHIYLTRDFHLGFAVDKLLPFKYERKYKQTERNSSGTVIPSSSYFRSTVKKSKSVSSILIGRYFLLYNDKKATNVVILPTVTKCSET